MWGQVKLKPIIINAGYWEKRGKKAEHIIQFVISDEPPEVKRGVKHVGQAQVWEEEER